MERWKDRSTFFIQTNNSLEAINRKRRDISRKAVTKVLTESGAATAIVNAAVAAIGGWLENCGPTSMCNLLAEAGYDLTIKFPGIGTIQAEDALAIWMNDASSIVVERKARPDIDPAEYLGNEIPQYYAGAVKGLFNATARFIPMIGFKDVAALFRDGSVSGIMICLKNPGHFLAVVHYDEATKELIYRDPWPGRTGTDGFNLRMGEPEYSQNVQPWVICVYPPEVI